MSVWLNPSLYIPPTYFPPAWSLSHESSTLLDDEKRGKNVVMLTQDSEDSSVGRRWVINYRFEGNWGNLSLKSTQEGTCIKCPKMHLYWLSKGFGVTMTVSCVIFLCLFNQETHYWQGDSSADAVVMSGVRCSGTELTLDQCLHHGKHINCPKGGGRFAAGVSCTQSKKTF